MRLNRLDLTRYGRFTDLSLEFPPPAPDGPDLHVIHGPNEAGKSTLLEGWLDLLFQIPARSDMNFKHPYKSMQLGAALHVDGQTHEVLRVKKRDASLLDANRAPLGEALLQAGLRGLDRAAYAAMFSLNRQTLDEGGESILASKGDLGALLFQASAGLTDLAGQLDGLRAQSEEFLNRTGRKGRLRDLGRALEELTGQIRDLDIAAPEYARLSAEREKARDAWHSARAAADAAQTEVARTERMIEALPLLARLDRQDAQIAAYGGLPEPPEGWLAELPALDREETASATRLETAQSTVATLKSELQDCLPDQPVLDAHEEIAAAEALKSAHDEAVKDLPRRHSDLEARTEALQEALARLGQPGADPAALLPEARQLGLLRDLIERHSGIKTAGAGARKELDSAAAELQRATRRLHDLGGGASGLDGLDGLVQTLRRDDPAGECDRATARADDTAAELDSALAGLLPWSGGSAALVEITAPDRTALEHLEADIARATRDTERAQDRLDQFEQVLEQAEARLGTIGTATAVSAEEAARIRSRRETEWSHHRATLTGDSADRFEEAMRLDDQVTAMLAQHRAHAEKTADARRDMAEAERQVIRARAQRDAATERHAALENSLAGLVRAASAALPPGMSMAAFSAWLDRLTAARDASERHDRAQRERIRREESRDRARADLLAALARAGQDLPGTTGLAPALEAAQSLLDRVARIEALRETEAAARQELARREDDMRAAEAARAGWQAEWEAACAGTWMAAATPAVAEMRAILEELERLRQHHREISDLTHRIQTMQSNRDRFADAVLALGGRLDLGSDAAVPELWRALTARQQQAERQETQRADIAARLAQARQSLAGIEEQAKIHRQRTAEFARHFGVSGWSEARDALTRAGELSALRAARRDLAEDLCLRMRSDTVEAARVQVQEVDADALEAQARRLRGELEGLRAVQEAAQDSYRKANEAVEAVGGDAAVARLDEQRQTLLLEIEDGARRHLRQRLGLLAVETALKRYRDTHRSEMLDRASEAFRMMTRNRYSGLAAQPDGTREVLVALAADGGSRQADQLSDGTRAQLYLSLRIAGYHEFIRSNGPIPFIADDIMESFDDERTIEAFRLLAGMSQSGQVIYLTHHAHLRDIARAACAAVQIHELPD